MISDKTIDQAFSDLKSTCAGVRNDYFGLLYLEHEHDVPRAKAVNQIAFGGNDYGLDGFHFDPQRRNLYLFQFKYSTAHAQFKGSLQRLIAAGMERIFVSPNKDDSKNQILLQLRSCMIENRAITDQVCFRFVFTGDPAEAERSQVLDKLREDLENKKYLMDQFFGERQVTLVVEFRSSEGKVGPVVDQRTTLTYKVPMSEVISRPGPNGESMHIGFVRLVDLSRMHSEMGQRFFERNIRYGLGGNETVNRVLTRSFRGIVLDNKESPEVFAFNHNGITLYAEKIEYHDGRVQLTAPRLLNGAQTVTTFAEFLRANADNPTLAGHHPALEEMAVMCRIITGAKPEFVTSVTINNNRQNPVEPWNLHANDLIQLELQDRFRDDLGIYYERQENAFDNLTQEEMQATGIREVKAIQMVRLAQTFAVSDGDVDKLSRMRQVFEDDATYSRVFSESRLNADFRRIVLCYNIQFRLRKLLGAIADRGPNKYWYINRARALLWALLCQGVLNHPEITSLAESYGESMSIPANYTAELEAIATARCRVLISDLVDDKAYADKVANANYSFLRTNTAYKRCMDIAHRRWKWVEIRLK